jgi:hypothetical protein
VHCVTHRSVLRERVVYLAAICALRDAQECSQRASGLSAAIRSDSVTHMSDLREQVVYLQRSVHCVIHGSVCVCAIRSQRASGLSAAICALRDAQECSQRASGLSAAICALRDV